MIQFKNITKVYKNGTVAVKDFTLDLRKGEIFALLGPNGAGKSTILKMLTTILKPTSGRILIQGIDIWSDNFHEIQKIKWWMGYQPETPYLFNKLTAKEYLDFVAALYGMPNDQKEDKIEYYFRFFELEGAKNNYLETYSFGMQKKVSLIAALIHSPDILVLDEPTAGLDPETTYKIKKLLTEHKENNKLVFFTTHILEIAEMIATKVGVIDDGELIFAGTLTELRTLFSSKDASLESLYLKLVSKDGSVL